MQNYYIKRSDLQCPDTCLKEILKKIICDYACGTGSTVPTVAVTILNGILTVTVNGVSSSANLSSAGVQTLSLVGNLLTISGGNTIDLSALVHPAVNATQSNAPYNFNFATQTFNFPNIPSLTDNGNGTITFTKGDGSVPTIISLPDSKTNTSITIGSITYPVGTDFEVLINALNVSNIVTTYTDTTGPNKHKIGEYKNETGAIVEVFETGEITQTFTPILETTTVVLFQNPLYLKVYRNGMLLNSTEYSVAGNVVIFTIPFGISGNAQYSEVVVVNYK